MHQQVKKKTRLSRIGYDNSIGYLAGGLENWIAAGKEIDTLKSIDAVTFETEANANPINILDVRKDGEFNADHLTEAKHYSLGRISEEMSGLDKSATYYIHCAGGYRSVIFASILKSRGYHNLIDIAGGYKAISDNTKLKRVETACTAS